MNKLVSESFQKFSEKVPTRFDDITKEVMMEKAGVKAYKKVTEQMGDISYYKLGDKLGEVLNKIV